MRKYHVRFLGGKGVAIEKVENLNQTAGVLGENMDELKTEISVFKTE